MNDDSKPRSVRTELANIEIRVAESGDLQALEVLVRESFAELGRIDTSLIEDGTLYVATLSGSIVGCGGWSGRRNLMPHAKGINPSGDMIFAHKDAAVLRLFCVRPDLSRQGIATSLFHKCRAEVESNGYLRLEVLAAASAQAAARSFGFRDESEVQLHFEDGSHIVSHRMSMQI